MAIAHQTGYAGELKQLIKTSPFVLAEHPFVEGISKGSLRIEQIRGWAMQDSHYRRAVPRLAMVRYLRCTDPEIQQRLAGVVAEESEGGQYGSSGHYDLFLRLAAAVGASPDEVNNSRPHAGPAAHIYWAELIAWTLPWFVAMSAQLAGEGQFPAASGKLSDGMMEHYGLTREQVEFFDAHGEADQDHGSLAEDIVNRYIVTPELQAQARAVVQRKLELQWDMWSSFEAY